VVGGPAEAEAAGAVVSRLMRGAAGRLAVPLAVKVRAGERWAF
jgi:DNA polymerase I-like protein with 3'-5' exonuclease and polymerase domains